MEYTVIKKIFISLFVFLLISCSFVYIFLFTSFGNSFVASILEEKANEKGIVAFKVEQFALDLNNIKLISTIDTDSKITFVGTYDIFSQTVDINYLVDIKDLSKFEKFTSEKLTGSLALVGVIKGDAQKTIITGKTNIFESHTTYDISLKDFEPEMMNLIVESAKIEQVLALSNQPMYAKGLININAKIENTSLENLLGSVKLNIKNGVLNNEVMNKTLDMKLTKRVNFDVEILSKLIPNKVVSNIKLNSSLANITLEHNILNIKEKSINSDYLLRVRRLSDLSDFIQTNSKKGFRVNGVVSGDEKLLLTNGQSDIFQSKTKYEINLKNKKLNKIDVNIRNAQLDEVFAFANQPIFAKGLLNVDAKIKNANLGFLDGVLDLNIQKAKVNNTVVNKNFETKLKKAITFSLDLNTVLKKENAVSQLSFKSSFLNLEAKKLNVDLKNIYIKSDYRLNIAKLSNLYDLTNIKLKGGLSLEGNIYGDKKELKVEGKSKVFDSTTNMSLGLKEYKPSWLKINLKNAKIEKLLHTLNQPSYANGTINVDANILNIDAEKLNGTIYTKILKGSLNNKIVNKELDLKLKEPFAFKGRISSELKPHNILSKIDLDSTMMNFVTQKTLFNLKTQGITSDYEVTVSDLNKWYDLTGTQLRGKVKVNGKIIQEKDLLVEGKSKLLGGNLNFRLKNDDLVISSAGIDTKQLLHMLYYPLFFDSKAKSELKYNLKSQRGKLQTLLTQGHILPNQYTNTIKSLTKFDLTREAYTKATINSIINKKIIKSTLDMESKNSEIDVPRSVIDLNKRTVQALVQTRFDEVEFDTKISGSLDKPKVRIQTQKLIESTLKTKVFEELEDKVIKHLGDDGTKELIKGLKGLFE